MKKTLIASLVAGALLPSISLAEYGDLSFVSAETAQAITSGTYIPPIDNEQVMNFLFENQDYLKISKNDIEKHKQLVNFKEGLEYYSNIPELLDSNTQQAIKDIKIANKPLNEIISNFIEYEVSNQRIKSISDAANTLDSLTTNVLTETQLNNLAYRLDNIYASKNFDFNKGETLKSKMIVATIKNNPQFKKRGSGDIFLEAFGDSIEDVKPALAFGLSGSKVLLSITPAGKAIKEGLKKGTKITNESIKFAQGLDTKVKVIDLGINGYNAAVLALTPAISNLTETAMNYCLGSTSENSEALSKAIDTAIYQYNLYQGKNAGGRIVENIKKTFDSIKYLKASIDRREAINKSKLFNNPKQHYSSLSDTNNLDFINLIKTVATDKADEDFVNSLFGFLIVASDSLDGLTKDKLDIKSWAEAGRDLYKSFADINNRLNYRKLRSSNRILEAYLQGNRNTISLYKSITNEVNDNLSPEVIVEPKRIKHQSNKEYNKYASASSISENPTTTKDIDIEKTYTPKDISNTNTPVDKTQIVKKAEKPKPRVEKPKKEPVEIKVEPTVKQEKPNKHQVNKDEVIARRKAKLKAEKKAREEAEAKRRAEEQARKDAEEKRLAEDQKIQALESELQRRYARNVALKERYKKLKLEFEKQQWSDFYKVGVTQAEVNQVAKELDESAAAVQKSRRELGIGKYEQRETIPFGSKGKAVSDYVDNGLSKFKQENNLKVSEKKENLEKLLAKTKSEIENYTLEYQESLKKLQEANKKLQEANYKPKKGQEKEIAKLTKKINAWKAEAEKNRVKANDYIQQHFNAEKNLAYAEIEENHYDGNEATYDPKKSALDKEYANKKPDLIAKTELDQNYNDLMAILNQPIEKDPVEEPKTEQSAAGEYRGFYSTTDTTDSDADFGYAELGENSSLTSNSKIVTRFGNKGEGMENDNLTTGDGDHLGNYQYVGLGKWSSPNNKFTFEDDGDKTLKTHNVDKGYWVFGKPTQDLPKSGSASFLGEVLGYVNHNNVELQELDGEIGLKVDFDTKKIAGKMNVDYVDSGWGNFAKVKFSNGTVDLATTGDVPERVKDRDFSSFFDGEFVSDNSTKLYWGDIVGAFYGDDASEAGGVWELRNHNGDASGVFRAKQTSESNSLIPKDPNKVLGKDNVRPEDDPFYVKPDPNVTVEGESNNSDEEEKRKKDEEAKRNTEKVADADPFYIEPNPSVSGGDAQYTHYYNLEAINNSDYDYVKWGQWNDSGNNVYDVRFESGTTASSNMPKIGHATYSGDVRGDYMNDNTKTYYHGDIGGNINFTANFDDKTVRGNLHTIRNSNGETFTDSNFYVRLDGSEFNGKITDKIKGNISGRFYGSEAQEAFGGFELNNSNKNERVIGNFRAKKQ